MNKKHISGVFMMEMIVVVFFFVLTASVCIQTFVKADGISKKAMNLNQSVFIAQSVAEIWKAKGSEGLIQYFYAKESETGEYTIHLNDDGSPVEAGSSVYTVIIPFKDSKEDLEADITVNHDNKSVYTLRVDRHEAGK